MKESALTYTVHIWDHTLAHSCAHTQIKYTQDIRKRKISNQLHYPKGIEQICKCLACWDIKDPM